MLKVEYQGQFKKDYTLAVKRGCNLKLLADVITMLVNEKPLPPKYKDHSLADSRNYKRMRACRIQPDWLLVWRPEPFWFRALLLFLLSLKHSLRASAAGSCFLHNMYIQ